MEGNTDLIVYIERETSLMALKPPKNNQFADRENRYGVTWNKCGKFLNGKSHIIERGTDQEIR